MTTSPRVWTEAELAAAAAVSTVNFRAERLQMVDEWKADFKETSGRFKKLIAALGDLMPSAVTDDALSAVFGDQLLDALRYLSGPPISEDDIQVLADVESTAPTRLQNDPAMARRIYDVVIRTLDPFRFPWVSAGRAPTTAERDAAILVSAALHSAQRIAATRRNDGKTEQENAVKDFLKAHCFKEVRTRRINTIMHGPQAGEFSGECHLGDRKADIVVRLHDTRILAIECKVSNSSTNSVKRLNNDAAVKAGYWLDQFGTSQVVPAATLSGVFKTHNLVQAQNRGLFLFWAHDLAPLGAFIDGTK
jgi:hypothetical protein